MAQKKVAPKKKVAKRPAPVAKKPVRSKKVATKRVAAPRRSSAKKMSNLNPRVVMAVILVAILAIGMSMFFSSSKNDFGVSPKEDEIITDIDDIACYSNDVEEQQANCPNYENLASQGLVTEAPSCVDAGDCETTATLGATTIDFDWPIKKENWQSSLSQPIANCDLIYSDRTLATGIEIAVPVKTKVYAAATGKVKLAEMRNGNGIIIIDTAIPSSAGGGKTVRINYNYLLDIVEGIKPGVTVQKGQYLAVTGETADDAELKGAPGLHFGIWRTVDSDGIVFGHVPYFDNATSTTIGTRAKTLVSKIYHPLNFLPQDGRKLAGCPNVQPGSFHLPGSGTNILRQTGSTPTPTPTPPATPSITFPIKTTKSKISNRSIFRNGTTNTAGHPYIAYDILVPVNSPIVAMYPGVVTRLSKDRCDTHIVGIYNAGKDLRYSYMHLKSNIQVKLGEKVQPGKVLGYTAPGPCDTPSHLHLDAIKGRDRLSCSRLGCSSYVKSLFVSLGKDLYNTYQKLPN